MKLKNIVLVSNETQQSVRAYECAKALADRHEAQLEILSSDDLWRLRDGKVGAQWPSDHPADLIVVASHGRTGLEKMEQGSLAEQIFRKSKCPALLFGPNVESCCASGEYHTILLPTDFGPEANAAVPMAARLAREYQAQLLVLHVVPDTADDTGKLYAAAEAKLAALVREIDECLWQRPKILVEVGSPVKTILRVAHEQEADLIVMGAHKLTGAPLEALWTTAYQVLCAAHAPLLTVGAESVVAAKAEVMPAA